MELESLDFDLRTAVENVAEMLAAKAKKKGIEFSCSISALVPSSLIGSREAEADISEYCK